MADLQHLAIIMDGNGRWAQQRGQPRSYGHIKGTRVAKKIITACSKRNIKWLTLYAFSAENWMRPQSEVGLLMRILKRYLDREVENLKKENIRVHVIGDLSKLPQNVMASLQNAIQKTAHCDGLQLAFCLSYGSRQEITSAVQALAYRVQAGELNAKDIDESMISQSLWSSSMPSPDLILRTSGEQRLSNFLLWQAAYSEFYFTNTLWPDFETSELDQILSSFSQRERRFGKLKEPREKPASTSH